MASLFQNRPTEPMIGLRCNPKDYGDYKSECVSFLKNHVLIHKPKYSEEHIIANLMASFQLVADNPVLVMKPNRIQRDFGLWVFVALYIRNAHTISSTGAYNITLAGMIAQRTQVELLRMVVLELIESKGIHETRLMLNREIGVKEIPFDAFLLDSTLLEPSINLLMWYWLCLVASCFPDQKIKELLDSHIQKEFTDTSIVAEYIYDAGQVNFDDNLERYLSRYEQDYMMQYGLDLSNIEHLGQAGNLETSSFINQLLSVKAKWPN